MILFLASGKMYWFDRGEEYDGKWVEGVQNGNGKHTWYSKRVTVSQYPIRNEYEGSFVNGERHGYGVFRYASGARYSGYWNKNLKSGRGEFMFKNGSVFKGDFTTVCTLPFFILFRLNWTSKCWKIVLIKLMCYVDTMWFLGSYNSIIR